MANNAALNGLDFYTQYSVGVTSIKGHLDMPNPKKRISKSWDDENGEDVYVGKSYFEAREITMELFIQAATKALFVSKIKVFFDAIRANGLQALTLGNIPKTFLVYYKDSDEMVRLSIWNDTLMIGNNKLAYKFHAYHYKSINHCLGRRNHGHNNRNGSNKVKDICHSSSQDNRYLR
jgi:hypothetical protein